MQVPVTLFNFIICVAEQVTFMFTFGQAVQTGKKEEQNVDPAFEGAVI